MGELFLLASHHPGTGLLFMPATTTGTAIAARALLPPSATTHFAYSLW